MPALALAGRVVLAAFLRRTLKIALLFALGLLLFISSLCSPGPMRTRPAPGGGVAIVGAPGPAGFLVVPDDTLLAPRPDQPAASSAAVASLGPRIVGLLQASATQAPCVVAWPVLAGVASVEDSSFGAKRAIGSAIPLADGRVIHAYGPAQFLLDTWATYGDGADPPARFAGPNELPPADTAHIWQPEAAYPALARYLCALGVATDPISALWRYSGCLPGPRCARTDRYPFDVMARAAQFAVLDAAPSVSPLVDELLREARSWLGVRYVFGGCTRGGVDCSCFVELVYGAVGIQLSRSTQLQFNETVLRGRRVSTPRPGDLVFFAHTYFDPQQDVTHVGIVTRVNADGSVVMIHAPGARAPGDPPDMPFGQVREETIGVSLASKLAGYARVLPSPPAANQG